MNVAPEPTLPCVLAIDQGSHASKALVIDSAGRVVARAEAPIATLRPRAGWVEHDTEALVESVRQAIDIALAQPGISRLPIARAGLATQRSSIACWNRASGTALSPVISWQDRRNAAWLHELALDPAWVHDVTGLVPSPHYGASKLRWCLDHLPAVRAAADAGTLCCGPLSSFILHRLLRDRPNVADPANASRTLLWDLESGDWSPLLLERFGIDAAWLPRCVPSRHAFGVLEAGDREIPLVVTTGDQSAALFAAGTPGSDTFYVNIGTGGFVQRAFAGSPPRATGLLRSVAWRSAESSVSVLEGTVNGAGAAFEWLAEQRGVPVAKLLSLAAELDAAEPLLFINCVGGLGSPWWVATGEPKFTARGGLAGEAAAVLESIVFLLCANIDALLAATGVSKESVRRIQLSGGLARIERLGQALADLTGLPVERLVEVEATAMGLAFLLGASPPRAEAPDWQAKPRSAAALHARYREWCDAVAKLTREDSGAASK